MAVSSPSPAPTDIFEVYNMSGMACVAGEITGGTAEIQASALTPGIYVARNAAGQTVKFVTK